MMSKHGSGGAKDLCVVPDDILAGIHEAPVAETTIVSSLGAYMGQASSEVGYATEEGTSCRGCASPTEIMVDKGRTRMRVERAKNKGALELETSINYRSQPGYMAFPPSHG